MVWYSRLFKNFLQFVVIHTVKGFGIVNEAEVDVFLEFSCFFYDPADVGNLISGSSTFSKSILNIWKFSVHILLKPSLGNFEHYFASILSILNTILWVGFGELPCYQQPWLWKNKTNTVILKSLKASVFYFLDFEGSFS